MRFVVATLAGLVLSVTAVEARNTPCSGKKGGIVACRGEKFVCANKSESASKEKCSGHKIVP